MKQSRPFAPLGQRTQETRPKAHLTPAHKVAVNRSPLRRTAGQIAPRTSHRSIKISARTTSSKLARGRPIRPRFFQYLHVYGGYMLAEPGNFSLTCPIDHAPSSYHDPWRLFKHSLVNKPRLHLFDLAGVRSALLAQFEVHARMSEDAALRTGAKWRRLHAPARQSEFTT